MAQSEQNGKRYKVGELLEYDVFFNFIQAGSASLEIADTTRVNGFPVYRIISITQTGRFFDRIYKIRDRVESYVDISTLYSRGFEKRIREGSYRKNYSVTFNYDDFTAITPKDTMPVPGFMHDAVSIFYYIRADSLWPGKILELNNFDNNKIKLFKSIVKGTEEVEVPAGKFDCFVLEPLESEGSLLKYEGTLTIWVARDHGFLPVLLRSKATIGAMILKLKSLPR